MRSILFSFLRIGIPLVAALLYAWHITPRWCDSLAMYPWAIGAHSPESPKPHLSLYNYRRQREKDLGSLAQRLGWQDTFFNIETTLRIQRIEDLPSFPYSAAMV